MRELTYQLLGNRSTLVAHTGVVLQGDTLFSGSIRDNVALFDLEPDEERVRNCLSHCRRG